MDETSVERRDPFVEGRGKPATESFHTTHLNVAAFLVARGIPLLDTAPAPANGRHKAFVFPAEARALSAQYYADAQVSARAFANALRDLKTLLYPRR